jgi:hypothetical protein
MDATSPYDYACGSSFVDVCTDVPCLNGGMLPFRSTAGKLIIVYFRQRLRKV